MSIYSFYSHAQLLYLPAIAANKDLTLGRVNLVAGEGANLEPKCMHPSIYRIHPSYLIHPSIIHRLFLMLLIILRYLLHLSNEQK